jgi:hypothetical protein
MMRVVSTNPSPTLVLDLVPRGSMDVQLEACIVPAHLELPRQYPPAFGGSHEFVMILTHHCSAVAIRHFMPCPYVADATRSVSAWKFYLNVRKMMRAACEALHSLHGFMDGACPSSLQPRLRPNVQKTVFREGTGEEVHIQQIHATAILMEYVRDFLAI